MDIHAGRQRPFPAVAIVAVLLLLCIYPGQSLVAHWFPGIPGPLKIRPSLVFLEIPIHLPVAIDLILVPGLFLLIYPLVIMVYPPQTGIPSWRQAVQRVKSVFAGLFILLLCMVSGGLIYYLVRDYLPRRIQIGIDSFGMNTDIYLPYPGHETIHVRGSTVLFMCFMIGMLICIRKIKKEPGAQKAGRLTREQRMTPYERMMEEKRKPAKNRKPSGIEQEATRPRNDRPGLCCSKPVTAFRPEAVNYMPM